MSTKIIIALNYQEYLQFLKYHGDDKGLIGYKLRYIGDPSQGTTPDALRGIQNPSGFFYRRWYLRDDLLHIFIRLKMTTEDDSVNKRLSEIYEYGMQKRKEHEELNKQP